MQITTIGADNGDLSSLAKAPLEMDGSRLNRKWKCHRAASFADLKW